MAATKSKTNAPVKTVSKTVTPSNAGSTTQSARTVGGTADLPSTMLDGWAREHSFQWGNDEWQGLLQNLRTHGMARFADTDDGRNQVGRYLEEARRRFLEGKIQTALKPIRSELDAWVGHRQGWSHDDWMGLLDGLRRKGFAHVDEHETRMAIGLYLEEARAHHKR